MNEFVIPIGDAKIFFNTGGKVKEYALDCVPLRALKRDSKSFALSKNEYEDVIDYFPTQSSTTITGFRMREINRHYKGLYIYLPGMHHITWSDIHLFDMPYINSTDKSTTTRRVEAKAFAASSDDVVVGLCVNDVFYKTTKYILKSVGRNSWNSVLTAVGLPDPIRKRRIKFKISEEMYLRLKDILFAYREQKSYMDKFLHLKEYDLLIKQWIHDLVSPVLGTFNTDNYEINYRAISCHPDIGIILKEILWSQNYMCAYKCKTALNIQRTRMIINLNRLLMRRKIDDSK